ncbi:MAG TPA: oxidoreductase [Sulfurospirillum arcachonense]|nr:oxidoreductase [Sulfurospirillum arcachonense]
MTNLWNDINLRVFTSNLLGQSDELVLHGGGNTSVKAKVDGEEILFVKGSGWDLVSIKAEGFAPVKMKTLLDMAKLDTLSDADMVSGQKAAMIDKSAPSPSVEAILHALIPFKVVDHTHADAVVTISNSKNGIEHIKNLYPNFLIVPYVMPGFILAKTIYDMTQNFDWSTCKGIILHNHGIFTFDDDAKKSYDKMIEEVSVAEEFLNQNAKLDINPLPSQKYLNLDKLKVLIEHHKGHKVSLHVNKSALALFYASKENLKEFATRGVLTPEHIIRTKRVPMVIEDEMEEAIYDFMGEYKKYFEEFSSNEICLNVAPNYAVIKDFGIVTFGKNEKEASILNDIVEHTMLAVLRADKLGGYQGISLKDCFEMEYWELEQAKVKKNHNI